MFWHFGIEFKSCYPEHCHLDRPRSSHLKPLNSEVKFFWVVKMFRNYIDFRLLPDFFFMERTDGVATTFYTVTCVLILFTQWKRCNCCIALDCCSLLLEKCFQLSLLTFPENFLSCRHYPVQSPTNVLPSFGVRLCSAIYPCFLDCFHEIKLAFSASTKFSLEVSICNGKLKILTALLFSISRHSLRENKLSRFSNNC